MMKTNNDTKEDSAWRFFKRGPWENFALILIALGIFMLMQSFSMVFFTYSFSVILTGTIMFLVVSHFPE